MSGLTPVQLLVLSGLLQNKGLQIPADLSTRLNTLLNTSNTFGKLAYIVSDAKVMATHPTMISALRGLAYGLCGAMPLDYTTNPPVGVRPNQVLGSVRSRANAILGNGLKSLLEALGAATGVASTNYGVYGSLTKFEDFAFGDVHLGATNYSDLISHGFTSSFGPTAQGTPAQASAAFNGQAINANVIKAHLVSLGNSLSNLGKLYDFNDLAGVGQPYSLVKTLSKGGAYHSTKLANLMSAANLNPKTITAADNIYLQQILLQITGFELTKVLQVTGFKLPSDSTVLGSAADLLIADKILPRDAAISIPGGDLTQLGPKLATLGVTSANIDSVSTIIRNLDVPTLQYLDQLQRVIPSVDATTIRNSLPTGTGVFGNPTVNDILGSVTGYAYDAQLDLILEAREALGSRPLYKTVVSCTTTYYNEVVAGNPTTGSRDALIAAITAMVANTDCQPAVNKANGAIIEITNLLIREINNSVAAGIRFNSNIEVYTTATLIDTFYANAYRSASYFLTVQNGTSFETTQAMLVQNDSAVAITTYGSSHVGSGSLGTLSATLSDGVVNVYYTAAQANANHYYLRPRVDYQPAHDGSDTGVIGSSIEEIGLVYKLIDAARDPQQLGVGDMLVRMASNDYYGDAIRAAVIQAQNGQNLETIGVQTPVADPSRVAKEMNSRSGVGLTQVQINIISDEANRRGANVQLALSDASLYGFNSAYYSARGYDI